MKRLILVIFFYLVLTPLYAQSFDRAIDDEKDTTGVYLSAESRYAKFEYAKHWVLAYADTSQVNDEQYLKALLEFIGYYGVITALYIDTTTHLTGYNYLINNGIPVIIIQDWYNNVGGMDIRLSDEINSKDCLSTFAASRLFWREDYFYFTKSNGNESINSILAPWPAEHNDPLLSSRRRSILRNL